MFRLTNLIAVAALFAMVAFAAANEEKIGLDKLPKAVVESVKAKYPEGKLTGAEKEKEDGKVVYEVKLTDKGHKLEVTLTPEGQIVSVEKVIPAKDLPQTVTDALEKKYPKATIKKVEEISKDDKVTAYEALIVTAENQKLEVKFDPEGKFLEEEKKGGEKEKK